MIKKKFESQKAISLISLSIAVIVILIITGIVLYNLQDNMGLERLRNMENDIENLRDKVDEYYAQYGTIPIIDTLYTNIYDINVKSVNDTGGYYIIDLSSIENLTLTYGEDYRNVNSVSDINSLEDIYIINEASHNIFYVKGITVDDVTYYTDYTSDDVDSEKVEIKYFDGVKIPEGFVYSSGTSANNLIIIGKSNYRLSYNWKTIDGKFTIDMLDSLNLSINSTSPEAYEAVESINRYHGYYKFYSNNSIKYINIDDEIWSPTYDKETKYTDINGDTASIPKGFQVSRVKGSSTVAEGLVARNASTDDRYVWVEVPKSIFKSVTSSEEYANIENDMKAYAKDYAADNRIDSDSSEKNIMLKSVYENSGFWVSQYEIGISNARTSSSSTTSETPKSQKNLYPYNYVSCSVAKSLANSMGTGVDGKTGNLLYGIQWDLMLKFIETREGKTKDEIKSDSSTWGNYNNADFYINRGEYYGTAWNTVSSYRKQKDNSILLTTGASRRNSALNIYDVAGNVYEWTNGIAIGRSLSCYRGGSYSATGTSAAYSYGAPMWANAGVENGFRVTLY